MAASGLTTVTVATNRRLTVNVSGFLYVFSGGDTVDVPTFEVTYLRRAGIIV